MSDSPWPTWESERTFVEAMNRLFERALDGTAFHVTVAGGDRHGSHVWEAAARDDLNRYILIGWTPTGNERGSEITLDGYYGADNGEKFRREYVPDLADWLKTELHIENWSRRERDGEVAPIVFLMKYAVGISESELDEGFLTPRRWGEEQLVG